MPSVPFAALVEAYRRTHQLGFEAPAALVLHEALRAASPTTNETTLMLRPPRASLSAMSVAEYGAVYEIRKRPESLFDHIGVGRVANVDVCIALPQVSSYHAYLTRRDDGSFLLADAGSRNGTRVGFQRLEPRTPVPLSNGARLYLGGHLFTFVTSAGLLALVQARCENGDERTDTVVDLGPASP